MNCEGSWRLVFVSSSFKTKTPESERRSWGRIEQVLQNLMSFMLSEYAKQLYFLSFIYHQKVHEVCALREQISLRKSKSRARFSTSSSSLASSNRISVLKKCLEMEQRYVSHCKKAIMYFKALSSKMMLCEHNISKSSIKFSLACIIYLDHDRSACREHS